MKVGVSVSFSTEKRVEEMKISLGFSRLEHLFSTQRRLTSVAIAYLRAGFWQSVAKS